MSEPATRRIGRFAWAYVRSMRLYYGFITGIAGWLGLAFARAYYPGSCTPLEAAIILAILFLSWGVNQIVNDYLGLAEDRINAPHRPMVTGELDPRAALAVSFVLIAFSVVVTWFLAPWALIPLFLATALNVAYEYAKGLPYLGNVVFGVMIATCTAYGFLASGPEFDVAFAWMASGPESDVLFTPPRLSGLFLVALMNGLMTYYTYFKDYAGDKAAGKVTAVVLQGLERSRLTAIVGAFLPSIALWTCIGLNWITAPLNDEFVFLFILTLFLQIWTGVLYYRHPSGPKAYYSLVTNFRACVAGQIVLIALFNPIMALYLFIASYVLIGFLFGLHDDPKA